ncbi:cyclase family protein [Rubrobacter taiwanensis]|jgi:arylformamidase|uniref:Cyclase family protein n=1 Tax=Rubrobacter taiwanensis TaxID=185139 RepID=A0A4R1BR61_9ACTN|nr:cyclase family protein [Rubrobacter taiwanensis]TCJ19675.1 cyclase family protein [Rubrobacter taiwanensis]
MPEFIRLSYDIRGGDPGWPGNPKYSYQRHTSIEDGSPANTYRLDLFNHFGTHLDAPNHFNPDGPKIADVPMDRFVYERPLLIETPKGSDELVMREELERHADAIRECDLLLLRSGWQRLRAEDPERYAGEGPGVAPEACEYLIEEFPGLKAVGMDWISLAAYRRPEEGKLAHQILCGVHHPGRYVIIIEDINLSLAPQEMRRVYAIPLFPEVVDSSPCTVFAESP